MNIFSTNVGAIDRVLRVALGLALLGLALGIGFPATGYNHLGWLGLVPLLTGLLGFCPVYAIAEISTARRRDPASRTKP